MNIKFCLLTLIFILSSGLQALDLPRDFDIAELKAYLFRKGVANTGVKPKYLFAAYLSGIQGRNFWIDGSQLTRKNRGNQLLALTSACNFGKRARIK